MVPKGENASTMQRLKKSHFPFLKAKIGFMNGFIYYSKSENFVIKSFAVADVREVISMEYGHKTLVLNGTKRLTGITLRWQIHLCGEN